MTKISGPASGSFAKTGILFLLLCLSACVSPVDYGPIRHSDYVKDDRCNPADSVGGAQTGLPYFFVTSRLPDCRYPTINLINHRSSQVRYGRFAEPAALPNAKGKLKPAVPLTIDGEVKWWSDLSSAMENGDGRVLVYVHGYRETFYSSSKDTAQIARLTAFNGPIVQYSWPSQGRLLKYGVDETNMYWDERNFRNFLKTLAQAKWTREIVLVSHSLGARLIIPAVEYVDENSASIDSSNISNIILASPDIDRQNFERDIAEEILAMRRVKNLRSITVYASAKDDALAISSDIHGYPRLGIPRCFDQFKADELKQQELPVRCYAQRTPGLTIVDTTAVSVGRSGHSDYLRSARVCLDFAQVVAGRTGSDRQPTHNVHVFTLPAHLKGDKPNHMAICRRPKE